jgi:cytochrome b subunit of formate dehydrogenase
MVDGKVSRGWAKKHPSEWYQEIAAEGQVSETREGTE